MPDLRSFFGGPPAKKARTEGALSQTRSAGSQSGWQKDPCKIMTWNANGLMARVTSQIDLAVFQEAVRTHDPDVICLQEARIKAHCSNPKAKVSSSDVRDRSRPLDSEMCGPLQEALNSEPLKSYAVFWSLANGRAAGTAMFVHQRLGDPGNFMRNSLISASVDGAGEQSCNKHHPEGRIQYARFQSFDLINTYVPNNGWTAERHAERKRWDDEFIAFLKSRSAVEKRPLIWCGDMNVAHQPADSTNEEFFRDEWDRDSKRFPSKEAYIEATPSDDRGIPGFSNNERKRFDALLSAGALFDAWRFLHPVKDPPPAPGDAAFTWRGTPAVQNNFRARYEGMGQRLDYFLLSEAMSTRLASCEILGHGSNRHGFLGSDHSPVLLQLHEAADTHACSEGKDTNAKSSGTCAALQKETGVVELD